MPRYFIEVAYKGGSFHGFQIQENGKTIQGELNNALTILVKQSVETTTSSRTDAGVHAYQNFLHWDSPIDLPRNAIYSLNSILPKEMAVLNIYPVSPSAHSRFDAIGRKYAYHITSFKNPFLSESSYHFPFKIELEKLHETAELLKQFEDFSSFSKRHTDVNTFNCTISESYWEQPSNNHLIYHVKSNRFLRGMVKAMVGTQLLVGRGKLSLEEFKEVLLAKDCTKADFSPPSMGLFLENVIYPTDYLQNPLPYK